MKSRFISDLQNGFDGQPSAEGFPVSANFLPASFFSPFATTGEGDGSSLANRFPHSPPTPTIPAEAVQADTAVTQSGSGGTGSVVEVTSSGGFTINLLFDAAAIVGASKFPRRHRAGGIDPVLDDHQQDHGQHQHRLQRNRRRRRRRSR